MDRYSLTAPVPLHACAAVAPLFFWAAAWQNAMINLHVSFSSSSLPLHILGVHAAVFPASSLPVPTGSIMWLIIASLSPQIGRDAPLSIYLQERVWLLLHDWKSQRAECKWNQIKRKFSLTSLPIPTGNMNGLSAFRCQLESTENVYYKLSTRPRYGWNQVLCTSELLQNDFYIPRNPDKLLYFYINTFILGHHLRDSSLLLQWLYS